MTHHIQSVVSLGGSAGCPGAMQRGDVYTHCFHGWTSTLSKRGVDKAALDARARGVLFDVGHGAGGFSWTAAETACKAGFWPDIISTDLHTASQKQHKLDLLTVATKLLHLGMPLPQVVQAMTSAPALAIQRTELGSLQVGREADVTIFKEEACSGDLEDCHGQTRRVDKRLVVRAVWRNGKQHEVQPTSPWPLPGGGNRLDLKSAFMKVQDCPCCAPPPPSFFQRQFGVPGIVNGLGTFTSLGGSRMCSEAIDASVAAAAEFVDLNALERAAGDEVCRLARAPAGYQAHICTGAAAGIVLAVAACMTGHDADLIQRLPYQCPKHEVLCDASTDIRWSRAARIPGATVRLVGSAEKPMTKEDIKSNLCDRTACIFLSAASIGQGGRLTLAETISAVGSVPVVVDAAAMLGGPDGAEALWSYTTQGASLVLFSGGKEIRGPQTTGIIIGKTDLVTACALNGSPHECTVGRAMKTTKDDIAGLLAALRVFVKRDFAAEMERHRCIIEDAARRLTAAGLASRLLVPTDLNVRPAVPRLHIDLPVDPAAKRPKLDGEPDHGDLVAAARAVGGPGGKLAEKLLGLKPPVLVFAEFDYIEVSPQVIGDDEFEHIIDKIEELA